LNPFKAFASNYRTMRSGAQAAGYGKRTAKTVSSMRTAGKSSGSAAMKKLAPVQNYVKANKGKSALMGGGAAIGIGGATRSRRSGLDKTRGRSTGMYKY
jgi:hypothetical protein